VTNPLLEGAGKGGSQSPLASKKKWQFTLQNYNLIVDTLSHGWPVCRNELTGTATRVW